MEGAGLSLRLWEVILLLIPLCAITLWIVISNSFVILAVMRYETMRTPSNIYLSSLAFTDFLVGALVLPFNIVQIVYNRWIFSENICKTWLTMDVTLSTLSILHLIAIAVDRYRAVSDGVTYLQRRSAKSVFTTIAYLWIICIWISTPPVLGWGRWKVYDPDLYICEYSTSLGYVLHSAFGSFILPMILMIKIYMKIYGKIQERLRAKAKAAIPSLDNSMERELSETEASGNFMSIRHEVLAQMSSARPTSQLYEFKAKKIRFSLTKEKRAARTLGMIIGAFMICWIPFCIMYVARPILGEPPIILYHLLTWLGYFNSAVNPVIYCVYNKDFKRAFHRMTCNCFNKE